MWCRRSHCYGCTSATVEHCITLLRAMATNSTLKSTLCGQVSVFCIMNSAYNCCNILQICDVCDFCHFISELLCPSHWVCKPAYLVPVSSQDKLGGLWQEKWGHHGGGSLISPDGVAPSRIVGVSVCGISPCTMCVCVVFKDVHLIYYSYCSPLLMEHIGSCDVHLRVCCFHPQYYYDALFFC